MTEISDAQFDDGGLLLIGDCIEQMSALPDGCIQTVVTSPPYYGLRDYGTGQWVGGDDACEHLQGSAVRRGNLAGSKWSTKGGATKVKSVPPLRQVGECGHCGALRLDHQIGVEPTLEAYIARMVDVFRAVRRVLRDDGTVWLNLGDSYAGSWGGEGTRITEGLKSRDSVANMPKRARAPGSTPSLKPKDMMGVPWRVAFALQADGWWLRQDIIWAKPNPLPENIGDRCTKAHEYIFLLSKSRRYHFDQASISEDASPNTHARSGPSGVPAISPKQSAAPVRSRAGDFVEKSSSAMVERRNKRSVWTVSGTGFSGAHFATFPPELIEPCVLAGAAPGRVVLDPFFGAGTTGLVARNLNRRWVGIELNADYAAMARRRIYGPLMAASHGP